MHSPTAHSPALVHSQRRSPPVTTATVAASVVAPITASAVAPVVSTVHSVVTPEASTTVAPSRALKFDDTTSKGGEQRAQQRAFSTPPPKYVCRCLIGGPPLGWLGGGSFLVQKKTFFFDTFRENGGA